MRNGSSQKKSCLLAAVLYLSAAHPPLYAQDTRLDLHADYPRQISERMKLNFTAAFFNVTNNRELRLPNQFRESTLGQLNPDFLQPQLLYLPFSMRLGMRLQW